jgi:hypothetical protein
MQNDQINLLKSAKIFLSSFRNINIFPQKNSIFYFATYSEFIGSFILNSFLNKKDKKYFKNFKIIVKDIFYSLNYVNCQIFKPYKIITNNKIIVTWAFEKNFNKDGSINDRYFNVNSNSTKNTLWFVIYLSKKNPSKIKNNIVLMKPETLKSFNVFKVIGALIKNFKYAFKNVKYYLALSSNHNFFAELFLKNIEPYLGNNIRFVLMPYEAQPFQNKLVDYINKQKKKIKTIGYIHSPPLALPANFIYKNSSPDKIILNGIDQFYCFTKILGWKKSRIKILPSLRFIQSNKKIKNTVFLPLKVRNIETIISSLKFLNNKKFINLKKFKVKNHPASTFSKINIETIQRVKNLKMLLNNQKNFFKKDYLIFIGNSGGIIEALERGSNVIQICENNIYDSYSSKIWKSIVVKKIHENIFMYKLKKKGNLIKLGKKRKNLNSLFN